jgi:hypothetical protein
LLSAAALIDLSPDCAKLEACNRTHANMLKQIAFSTTLTQTAVAVRARIGQTKLAFNG